MMKKALTLLTVVLVLGSIAFGRKLSYPTAKRPSLSLSQALVLGQKALGKDSARFYCASAELGVTTSPDGDWTLRFDSKNKKWAWVIVDFDGKVEVLKNKYLGH